MDFHKLLSKSKKRLDHPDLHPKVKEAAIELIKQAYAKGIYVVIVQGVRTMQEQAAIYAQGRTKPGKIVSMAKPGFSPHNYGLAIDYALLKPDGSTVHWDVSADFNRDHQRDWFQVGAIAKQLGFEWGGDWENFRDYPHCQMMFGLTINDLRKGKKPPSYYPQSAPKVVNKSVDNHNQTPTCNIVLNDTCTKLKGILKDNKSYLPVRNLAGLLGPHKVDWCNTNKKVLLDGFIFQSTIVVDGIGYAWSREIADALDMEVNWDDSTKTIKLKGAI